MTARIFPYDLAFQDAALESTRFPAIREEAATLSVRADDPEVFLELRSVGGILRTLLVDGEETAVEQMGPLLFQAYHFWQHGKTVLTLEEARFRSIVDDRAALADWALRAPARAGYLALPRNLLWARIRDDVKPEPVDGFFWTLSGEDPGTLHVLLVLGLLPGRPGFSIVELSAHLADAPAGHWGDIDAREEPGTDFSNVLPGGELQRLYALETAGEVLKLVSRVFHALIAAADG